MHIRNHSAALYVAIFFGLLGLAAREAQAAPARPGVKPAEREVILLPGKAALTRGAKIAKDAAGNIEPFDGPKSWVEWNGITPGSGWYQIEISQGAANADGTYEITIEGQTLTCAVKATGGWEKLEPVTLGALRFTGAQTYLTLKPTKLNGPLMKIGGLTLRPIDPPTIRANSEGVVVLRSRAAEVSGNAIRIDHTGQIADIRTGCTIEWTLAIPKAGVYEIELEQSSTSEGEFELTVGGQRLSAEVAVTGDWSKYAKSYAGFLRLPEGPTKLTMRAVRVGSSLMNLREMRLIPTEKPRPAPQRIAKADPPGRQPPVNPPVRPPVAVAPGRPTGPANPPAVIRPQPPARPQAEVAFTPSVIKHRLLLQHAGAVHAATFVVDGKTIVTAAEGGVTKIWNAAAGTEIAALTLAGRDSARVLALSPDGKQIAAAGEFDFIKLLNAATGAELASWPSQGGSLFGVNALVWSSDGRRLASAAGKLVIVWDAATHAVVSKPQVPANVNSVKGLAFAPDGSQLTAIMSGEDAAHRSVTLVAGFDPVTGKASRVLPFPSVGSMWVRYLSPKLLAMRYGSGTGLLDLPSGKVGIQLYASRGVACAATSRDGRLMAMGLVASDGRSSVDVWDIPSNTCIGLLAGHTDDITSIAFSPDGKSILTSSADKTARVYEVPTALPKPIDLKAVAARLTGTWRATPEVNNRLIRSLMVRQGVPPDKLEDAITQMQKKMTGLTLTYTFAADGNVAVGVTGGGETQTEKGRWEVIGARDTVIYVRLTSPTQEADLLTVHMGPIETEKFELAIPETPVRQPVEFTRTK